MSDQKLDVAGMINKKQEQYRPLTKEEVRSHLAENYSQDHVKEISTENKDVIVLEGYEDPIGRYPSLNTLSHREGPISSRSSEPTKNLESMLNEKMEHAVDNLPREYERDKMFYCSPSNPWKTNSNLYLFDSSSLQKVANEIAQNEGYKNLRSYLEDNKDEIFAKHAKKHENSLWGKEKLAYDLMHEENIGPDEGRALLKAMDGNLGISNELLKNDGEERINSEISSTYEDAIIFAAQQHLDFVIPKDIYNSKLEESLKNIRHEMLNDPQGNWNNSYSPMKDILNEGYFEFKDKANDEDHVKIPWNYYISKSWNGNKEGGLVSNKSVGWDYYGHLIPIGQNSENRLKFGDAPIILSPAGNTGSEKYGIDKDIPKTFYVFDRE